MAMPAVAVRAVPAVASDVPLTITAVGNVDALASVDVKSRVAGQVIRVDFQDGQNVQKGQLLFEIDPEPLQRQIAETQADLAKDAALEAQARANVIKDQATLKQSRSAADRGLQLSKEGIFSKEQTEQVVATADSTQASLDADKAAVDSAVAAIKADRARLAQTELQLTYTKVTAPISGRAGAISIKAGNLVKDNDTALVTLLQLSPIYVSFGVPEQILPEVQKFNSQRPLVVSASADGETSASGTLRFIDNTVDNTTGTIKLKAQFVNVQAQLAMEHNRVLVPSTTLQTGPQGKYVWVLNQSNGTVSMRPVQVLRNFKGSNSAENTVIGTGIQPGDMVISEGQMLLAPGSKVRLLKTEDQLGNSGAAKSAGQS